MVSLNEKLIIPRTIRLEASTICQLKCPTCPTAAGETARGLGWGCLTFCHFKKIVDENPFIGSIELSNWGEIFLNKELLEIIKYAYKNNVALHAANGVNLNTATPALLEALVKYKFRNISCSIDGASQETYSMYRRKGNFGQVNLNFRIPNFNIKDCYDQTHQLHQIAPITVREGFKCMNLAL